MSTTTIDLTEAQAELLATALGREAERHANSTSDWGKEQRDLARTLAIKVAEARRRLEYNA